MSIHGHEDSGLYQGLGSGMDYITRPSYERPPGSTYRHPSEDEEDNAFLYHLHDPVSRRDVVISFCNVECRTWNKINTK